MFGSGLRLTPQRECPSPSTIWTRTRAFPLAGAAAFGYFHAAGLVMARKEGKLPPPLHYQAYDLEYGSDSLELSHGVIGENETVWLAA